MRAKKRVEERIIESSSKRLEDALEIGTRAWPLPNPPIFNHDFPPIPPTSARNLIQQGLGIFQMDKGAFQRHLQSSVELVVPYRMGLTEDPFEEHEKWLMKRTESVVERILFSTCTDWLAAALDQEMPDTDRWWLAIALLNGLSTIPRGQPIHQGYHLIESIALGQRPGSWHTQPDSGPHQMEWNPQASVPKIGNLMAHESGSDAAIWMLEQLENGTVDRRLLLIEWCKLLLERPTLFEPLKLDEILLRRAADESDEIAANIVTCLAKLFDNNNYVGFAILELLNNREEEVVQRALADVLTRLFRRIEWKAVPLLEQMLKSSDENILAAASATVGDLKFLDVEKYANKVSELVDHPIAIVRRNLVSTLRDYITQFPDDEREVLDRLWVDGDEVVRTRLRELMLRLEEVDPTNFSFLIQRIAKDSMESLQPLWEVLEIRKEGRSAVWIEFLLGNSPPPSITPEPTNIEVGEITPNTNVAKPSLDEALNLIGSESEE